MAYVFDHKEVMKFIEDHKEYLKVASDLYEIYNRNITKHLKMRIDQDMESENSRKEAKSRLSPINILPKVVSKLSGVYQVTPVRTTTYNPNEFDAMLQGLSFEEKMQQSNNMLNLFRVFAVEPVAQIDANGDPIKSTVESLRVYPAHKFLLMDDGSIDNKVQLFIKIIGTGYRSDDPKKGQVEIYEAYSDTEYIKFDSKGVTSITPHDHGRIPVSWANRDIDTVMPISDEDTYQMVTLLPLLMSDMNYALKYKCFSIIYTIGLSMASGSLKPNSIWSLQAEGGGTLDAETKSEIGQLSPTIAVSEMLDAIYAQYSMWLESRNLKINSLAKSGSSSDNMSGIAKAIDNADVSEDITKQRKIFERVEQDLFSIIGKFMGTDLNVTVEFPSDTIIPETPKEKIERIALSKNEKLITHEKAIIEANPGMKKEELDAMIVELLADKEENSDGVGRNGSDNQASE